MADAGSIWFHALSGVGNNIGNAMQQYHQEHVAYDQQSQLAEALSRLAINSEGGISVIDPNTKDKTLQPIIDPKAKELFLAGTERNRAKATGALEALNRLGMSTIAQSLGPLKAQQIKQQRLQTELFQRAVDQPMGRLGTGELIINTPHGATVSGAGRGAATAVAEAGRAARFKATQALKARKDLLGQFATEFQPLGITSPNDFLSEDWQGGTLDDKGQFIPVPKGQAGGTHIRMGNDGTPITKDQFIKGRTLATQYQKLGQIGYGGLTGGTQDAPVKVNTPDEARQLDPGTIYETPNGDIYQVPLK